MQRKLMKSMEDLKVGYDYSVRDGAGSIVQYIYGDDGMNASCVESQPLYITEYDENKIAEMFYFDENTNWNKLLKINTKQKLEKISNYQEKLDRTSS